MKYKTIEEIMERRNQIKAEMEQEGADLDALEKEVRELKENEEELRKAAKAAEEKRKLIADGLGDVISAHQGEAEKPGLDEIRKSQKYIDAYANYIRTGDDRECRALLTENASTGGQVPVPVLVDQIVRTAWERNEILSRVRRTYFRGNVKVAFERSATAAAVHAEGAAAPTEETLTLGIVTMIPANIKKWIRISDEAVAMGGEAFLRYVYDELTYQIALKLAADVVSDIATAGTAHTATAVGVPKVSIAPGVITLRSAAANLSDEAGNLCVIMNRLSEAAFLEAYAAGSFGIDPFQGFTVLYSSALPAYSAASANAVYAIVGDLTGEQVNFPEGDNIIIKWDELTEAEKDLVKIVGREYVAHAVTAPGRFVNLTKPSA